MKEQEIIESLLQKSFLNGALNQLNVNDMKEGFHDEFAILIPQGDDLFKLPLKMWMNVVADYKATPEKKQSKLREVDSKVTLLDLTEKAAVVKVELVRGNQAISADYISLLKFPAGWKAVAKVSNEYISNPFNI